MNTIPTAKEFIQNYIKENNDDSFIDMEESMIEFAKMHVEAALEAAAIDATTKFIPFTDDEEVDRDSIRNAYPLENIK
jgi:hypothetical protein